MGSTCVVQTPRVKVEMGDCFVLYVQFGCHQRVPSLRTMIWVKTRNNQMVPMPASLR